MKNLLLKTHYFIDCPNHSKFMDLEGRRSILAKRIEDITCGQCKARILRELAKLNWDTLSIEITSLLSKIAERLVK